MFKLLIFYWKPGRVFLEITKHLSWSTNLYEIKLFFLSQALLFKQFVPGRAFQTICPKHRLPNNLSQAPLFKQFVPGTAPGLKFIETEALSQPLSEPFS